MDQARYIPTPSEIRQACLVEQRKWSPAERLRREVGRAAEWRPIVVPESIIQSAHAYAAGCSESRGHMQHSATS